LHSRSRRVRTTTALHYTLKLAGFLVRTSSVRKCSDRLCSTPPLCEVFPLTRPYVMDYRGAGGPSPSLLLPPADLTKEVGDPGATAILTEPAPSPLHLDLFTSSDGKPVTHIHYHYLASRECAGSVLPDCVLCISSASFHLPDQSFSDSGQQPPHHGSSDLRHYPSLINRVVPCISDRSESKLKTPCNKTLILAGILARTSNERIFSGQLCSTTNLPFNPISFLLVFEHAISFPIVLCLLRALLHLPSHFLSCARAVALEHFLLSPGISAQSDPLMGALAAALSLPSRPRGRGLLT